MAFGRAYRSLAASGSLGLEGVWTRNTLVNEKHQDDLLAVIHDLRKVIQAMLDWFKSQPNPATKADLKETENKIVATQTEVIAQLKAVQVTLNKVAVEETSLVDKIAELQKIIDGMGDTASPELVAAAQAVTDQAGVLDAIVPDVVPPTP